MRMVFSQKLQFLKPPEKLQLFRNLGARNHLAVNHVSPLIQSHPAGGIRIRHDASYH